MTETTEEDAYRFIGCVHVECVDDLPIEVAETRSFQADADAVLTMQERTDVHVYLALNPEAGDVMPGTGGIRKLRWPGNGKGKRGGYRVVYYYHDNQLPIYLLAIYSKGERIDLSESEKKQLRTFVRELVGEHRGRKTLRLIS